MYEVEVKVRADHEPVERVLVERGADIHGTVVQEDTYYDAPHRDFAETDEALRIRREWESDSPGGQESDEQADGPTVRLAFKGPLLEAASKSRKEYETDVDDGEALEGVLAGLGFEPAATVRKERDRYALDDYTVTLDTVDDLGEFVEVETETRDEDISAARDGALDLLASLGLDPHDQIRTSYLGLLLTADANE